MACFRPIEAWAPVAGGPVVFKEEKEHREIKIACGKCVGCMQVKQRDWAIRCMHEARMWEENSFITLTYEGDKIDLSLNYEDFRRFLWRFRKKIGPVRYFVAGEYGELNQRPHWHALLFGRGFADKVKCGENLWRSPTLEKIWQHGFSTVGDVTIQSAMYATKYATKVVCGDAGDKHYSRVDLRTGEDIRVREEFAEMSRNPGIGFTWFLKNWKEVYEARDGVVLQGGKTVPAPKYYDDLLREMSDERREEKSLARYKSSARFLEDTSPRRLAVREQCAIANIRRKETRL